MTNPVTLDIYHHTDSTTQRHDLRLDYDLEECELRPGIFYTINAVFPYKSGDKIISEIAAGSQTYICPLHPHEVAKEIKRQHLSSLINQSY